MPSTKPQVKAVIDECKAQRLREIAEKENRSVSNLLQVIIDNFLEEYEQKNGTINQVNIGRDNHGSISM